MCAVSGSRQRSFTLMRLAIDTHTPRAGVVQSMCCHVYSRMSRVSGWQQPMLTMMYKYTCILDAELCVSLQHVLWSFGATPSPFRPISVVLVSCMIDSFSDRGWLRLATLSNTFSAYSWHILYDYGVSRPRTCLSSCVMAFLLNYFLFPSYYTKLSRPMRSRTLGSRAPIDGQTRARGLEFWI